MKIQIGEVFLGKDGKTIPYPNKSHKYLFPALGVLGAEFVYQFNSVYKLAVGIGDILYTNGESSSLEQNLFVLLRTTIAPNHFKGFLDWIKEQDYYRDDYVFDNLQKSDLHMVVINLPGAVQSPYAAFLEGKYSQVFPTEWVEKFFKGFPDAYKVMIQDHEYKVKFVDKLNDEYLTNFSADEWEGDADKRPVHSEEVFNDHFIINELKDAEKQVSTVSRDTVQG